MSAKRVLPAVVTAGIGAVLCAGTPAHAEPLATRVCIEATFDTNKGEFTGLCETARMNAGNGPYRIYAAKEAGPGTGKIQCASLDRVETADRLPTHLRPFVIGRSIGFYSGCKKSWS
ncbi:hypothetical protein [Nocardia sp. NPDC051832]|uniref:hypothetical protein n=1 Tax=Nocardia sp. NPDC051832 TaxID=3155673 RepID=UPI0034174060